MTRIAVETGFKAASFEMFFSNLSVTMKTLDTFFANVNFTFKPLDSENFASSINV